MHFKQLLIRNDETAQNSCYAKFVTWVVICAPLSLIRIVLGHGLLDRFNGITSSLVKGVIMVSRFTGDGNEHSLQHAGCGEGTES